MTESIVQTKSFAFALEIIQLYTKLTNQREFILSKQLLRSGTSIGANIEEANGGLTRREFRAKMSIALKEARETHYWLRLLRASTLVHINVDSEILHVTELIRILTAIVKNSA